MTDDYEIDDKPFYVSFEALVPTQDDDEGTVLVKKLGSEYVDKSVYDLVNKVLDPNEDSMNDEYNAMEKDVANTVKGWFRNMSERPDDYSVSIVGFDENGEEVPLDLEKKVAEYSSLIKPEEKINEETGETEHYRLMELGGQTTMIGGYREISDLVGYE